jgi:hypothetical protein
LRGKVRILTRDFNAWFEVFGFLGFLGLFVSGSRILPHVATVLRNIANCANSRCDDLVYPRLTGKKKYKAWQKKKDVQDSRGRFLKTPYLIELWGDMKEAFRCAVDPAALSVAVLKDCTAVMSYRRLGLILCNQEAKHRVLLE